MGLVGSATQRGIVFVLAGGDDPHSPTILSRNIIMLRTQKERPLIDDWMRLTPPERCALQTVGAKAPLLAFCFHQFHFKNQLTLFFFFLKFPTHSQKTPGRWMVTIHLHLSFKAITQPLLFFFLKEKKNLLHFASSLCNLLFTLYITIIITIHSPVLNK